MYYVQLIHICYLHLIIHVLVNTAKVYLKSIHQKIIHCNEKKLGACSDTCPIKIQELVRTIFCTCNIPGKSSTEWNDDLTIGERIFYYQLSLNYTLTICRDTVCHSHVLRLQCITKSH